MARMCLGSDLNEDLRGKVYLMRNVQGERRLRVRSLGRDRCQKAGADVGAAGHSLHAQALVGVQHRYRLYAGQQGLRAAMASSAVDGDRRLAKSARSSNLPPHVRFGRCATRRDRAGAHLAPWCDLGA